MHKTSQVYLDKEIALSRRDTMKIFSFWLFFLISFNTFAQFDADYPFKQYECDFQGAIYENDTFYPNRGNFQGSISATMKPNTLNVMELDFNLQSLDAVDGPKHIITKQTMITDNGGMFYAQEDPDMIDFILGPNSVLMKPFYDMGLQLDLGNVHYTVMFYSEPISVNSKLLDAIYILAVDRQNNILASVGILDSNSDRNFVYLCNKSEIKKAP
jgi:hypothetical protein